MNRRVIAIIEDDVWRLLQNIPPKQRAQTVNQALREWAGKQPRTDALVDMDRYRDEMEKNPVTTGEIVSWIRADRDQGH